MITPFKIQIRFSDCDMMDHVNNAVYLSYIEMARIHYFTHLFGTDRDWKKNGIIVRKNEIEYLKPVLFRDEAFIHASITHIGNSSFVMAYELQVGKETYTKAESVLVYFNSETQQSTPIPEEFKVQLEKIKK